MADDVVILPMITALVTARPTYGYRRITALLNRQLRETGAAPVNHKRVYRIMQANNLLLARKYEERPDLAHDGKVIVMRANLRGCSNGFEFACWNGDIIRGTFIIDARYPGAVTPADQAMSKAFHDHFVAFAKNGTPGFAPYRPAEDKLMDDAPTRPVFVADPLRTRLDLMESIQQ